MSDQPPPDQPPPHVVNWLSQVVEAELFMTLGRDMLRKILMMIKYSDQLPIRDNICAIHPQGDTQTIPREQYLRIIEEQMALTESRWVYCANCKKCCGQGTQGAFTSDITMCPNCEKTFCPSCADRHEVEGENCINAPPNDAPVE